MRVRVKSPNRVFFNNFCVIIRVLNVFYRLWFHNILFNVRASNHRRLKVRWVYMHFFKFSYIASNLIGIFLNFVFKFVFIFLYLNYNVFIRSSNPYFEQFGTISFLFNFLILARMSSISLPKSVFRDFKSDRLGGPVHVNTLYIWFKVEFPGNIGLPFRIYPSKQPKLHTSTALVYFLEPSKI